MPRLSIKEHVELLQAIWKDRRTPWYARAVLGATVAYALSPVDLIPDFIPVIGHLDDIVIVPLGLLLTYMLVPRSIWKEHRQRLKTAPDAMRHGAVPGASATPRSGDPEGQQ